MQLSKLNKMKKNIFKKILYTGLISAGVLAFHACSEDYLDLKPEGRPTTGEVAIGGFEAQAFGLYSSLRSTGGVSDFDYVWTHIIRADAVSYTHLRAHET